MYSGMQPSGSISKWIILVAFFIFHVAESAETTQHVIIRKNCSDLDSRKYNCSAISENQCKNAKWRALIEVHCPTACGVCIECYDEVDECDNDMSICSEPEFNDFANANCKATCGRCAPSSSTTQTKSVPISTELETTKPTTTVATTVVTTTTEKVTTQPTTTKRGIGADLSCTEFNGVKYVYTRAAFSCSNEYSDTVCSSLFRADPAPGPGNDNPRPVNCYSNNPNGPIIPSLKNHAINKCAKTCGYCCSS